VCDRAKRACDDHAFAVRIAAAARTQAFEGFLKDWYAAPLWGGLAERCPDLLQRILWKRRMTCPQHAIRALLGMSLARQTDLWPGPADSSGDSPFWYAHGSLDLKFAALAEKLKPCANVRAFPGVGHAVVEECPSDVSALCLEIMGHAKQKQPVASGAKDPTVFRVIAGWTESIKLLLKAPLMLSRGDLIPQRCGVLVIIRVQVSSGHCCTGCGEISPLPLFHKESLTEAQTQLEAVLQAWASSPPVVPLAVARLNGAMKSWLFQHCPCGNALLPSVCCGLEMALLHALGRADGRPHLAAAATTSRGWTFSSSISINSLVAREEELGASCRGPTVVKVKVGKDPAEDAWRTNSLADLLQQQRGSDARIRLDANQAWTVDEAVNFINNLTEVSIACIEYLEEPTHWEGDSAKMMNDWEEVSKKTCRRMKLAVDESLSEGKISLSRLADCNAPIAALILKPALQGLENTMELAEWARIRGIQPVLSSAFESGVALCHFAILAGAMTWDATGLAHGNSACHGLGTFTRMAEDVLCPPFADLVRSWHGKGWYVDVLRCQESLDRTVDALLDARSQVEGNSIGP